MGESNGTLPPDGAAPSLPPGARFDRRLMERLQRAARRLMSEDDPGSLDGANAKLQAALKAHGGDLPTPMETPADRALERCYAAYGAADRSDAKRLAGEALAIDPACPEAFELLAEALADAEPPDYDGALAHLEKAAEFGRRRVPDATWDEMRGRLHGEVEARVVLRAKAAIADLEDRRGNLDRAVRVGRELLRLDAEDRLGVRHRHMVRLMLDGRDREAHDLALEEIDDSGPHAKGPAEAMLVRACAIFRLEGDIDEARAAFAETLAANRSLVGLLVDPAPVPEGAPDSPLHRARDGAMATLALFTPLFLEDLPLKEWFFERLKHGLFRTINDFARSAGAAKPPHRKRR